MRLKLLLLFMGVTMSVFAFEGQGDKKTGLDLTNLDKTVAPGADFFQYACGGWNKKHPLTPEYSSFGTFNLLNENNRSQLKRLILKLASSQNQKGSLAQKIADMYNLAMDSNRLNKEGGLPIKNDLAKIKAIDNKTQLFTVWGNMCAYINPFFSIDVTADDKNSTVNLLRFDQGGLGMDRDYYLEQNDKMKNVRVKYLAYIDKLFQLVGYSPATAKLNAEYVMSIEMSLAQKSRANEDLRDPYANYNKMPISQLSVKWPSFNWNLFLRYARLSAAKEVNVGQPEFMDEAIKLLSTLPLEQIKIYMEWNIINSSATALSDAFINAHFDFYGRTMRGRQQNSPRWKNAVSKVNGTLGEALGKLYVEKYFPAVSKARMLQLVQNLQKSLGQRIEEQAWMSSATKAKALEKLQAFRIKIGYPNKWKDYSNLNIDKKDSYYINGKRAASWEYNRMSEKLNKPVDPDEWYMTPQTVNAYYNPATNEICFPAGILQYPFFDMNADDAFNYGAIGVVIGHEMTHGFDDQGCQYDKNGNLNNWWTLEDTKNFKQRTKVMADFFSNIIVAPGLHANGNLTLGENIADHGGLQVSYNAFKNATKSMNLPVVDGFTPEQRFFLAYANVWAGNIRPEEILNLTKTDPHSLEKWRVDGALPHIDAWYMAFNITSKDLMFVPADKRVSIW